MLDHLASLLEYPKALPGAACAGALAACAGAHPRAAIRLAAFAGGTAGMPLLELQELYTHTFDFDAETALYVGHHLFAEEGRRGLLMAGLAERYQRLGIDPGLELSDHVAPVLRSLARDRESDEARELVHLALLPAISKVLPGLERRAPLYAAVVDAVLLVLGAEAPEPAPMVSDSWMSFSLPSSRT